MSYSRRVASWLFSLPAYFVQACARGAKLEMISVWLLFLKLLRATAGVKRPNGSEMNEGRKDSLNQQQKEQEDLSETVAMETSQLSEMADLKDYKMDLGDTEEDKCQPSEEERRDERGCSDACFPECLDTEKSNPPIADEHQSNDVANDCASSEETDRGPDLQNNILVVQETVEEESNLKESRPSPDSVDHQAQDQPVEEGGDDNPPPTSDANGTEHQENLPVDQEDNITSTLEQRHDCPTTEQEDNNPSDFETSGAEHQEPQDSPTVEQEGSKPTDVGANVAEHHEPQDSPTTEQEENKPSNFDDNVEEHQEPQESLNVEQENNTQSPLDAGEAEHEEPQGSRKLDQEDNTSSPFDASEAEHEEPQGSLKPDQEDNTSSPFDVGEAEHVEPQGSLETEQVNNLSTFASNEAENQGSPKTEQESVLEQQIKELVVSEASTESCHDNDRDDLSDCLQVEMAIVSSDSDVEEQWQSMFSPVAGKDNESGDVLGSDPPDVSTEPSNQEDATEEDSSILLESITVPEDEALLEKITESIDILEQPECPTECELEDLSYDGSIHYRSLTKIPEDEEDLNQNAKHSLQRLSASTSELDKKLPQDYCVMEEAKSENVSTEHLDFRMTRQQWQKMEEQNKGLLVQPNTKQGTCQGGHNFMYTPVRTMERPKKDQDSDSLSLGDYQFTQFSPCSEDSGLDDISYRSPYDEAETPVEKEIRETMEREESFRRERAVPRPSSGEPLESKPRPTNLLAGRSDPEERRRMYNTPEDRCRSQRSPGTRAPTFSITASPSSKPTYHEMVANNVIILEPDSYPASPARQRGKGLLSPGSSRFHEWPSDLSNVIILETSNLIIRSASEFCLSTACQETQESTFHNNPFFKLRSHSTQSLVDQEIKVVRQRDEEFRRQRAQLYTKEKYDTVLVSPSLLESFTYDRAGEIPSKCKSSPSSPSKIRKMDRSVLSCDQKFPEAPASRVRRKSALVQRWEAMMFANHHKD